MQKITEQFSKRERSEIMLKICFLNTRFKNFILELKKRTGKKFWINAKNFEDKTVIKEEIKNLQMEFQVI